MKENKKIKKYHRQSLKNQAGFTLIEMIIYLALYGIVIGGVVVAAYIMFESNSRNQSKAMIQEEGTYLIGKIDWALTGAIAVDFSANNQQLYVNRSGILASDNPLTFDASAGGLRLTRGTTSAHVLNNSNITIVNPIFVHATSSGDGLTPESIRATFTLTTKTPTGLTYSQDFSTIKYIRK